MKDLAPIILFVYNRPFHTQKTLECLQNNSFISDSTLFVFSDGAKEESDQAKVKNVRKLFDNISGFNTIEVINREKNYGLAKSIISGVTEVLRSHNSVIVLEDDLITSNNFISFMNEALDFYEENKTIFSISGYCHPIKFPSDYREKVFISHRASSWGWATWKDRWAKVDWEFNNFNTFLCDKNLQKQFNLNGEDLSPMLKSQMYGYIDSWAIRWTYAHFINKKFCIYPVKSKVNHFGDDEEGTHKHTKHKYDTLLDDGKDKYNFPTTLSLNPIILKNINKLVRPSLVRKAINYVKFKFKN